MTAAPDAATLSDDERTPCEVWTRVMGYHRPVASFNTGKQGEHAALATKGVAHASMTMGAGGVVAVQEVLHAAHFACQRDLTLFLLGFGAFDVLFLHLALLSIRSSAHTQNNRYLCNSGEEGACTSFLHKTQVPV